MMENSILMLGCRGVFENGGQNNEALMMLYHCLSRSIADHLSKVALHLDIYLSSKGCVTFIF